MSIMDVGREDLFKEHKDWQKAFSEQANYISSTVVMLLFCWQQNRLCHMGVYRPDSNAEQKNWVWKTNYMFQIKKQNKNSTKGAPHMVERTHLILILIHFISNPNEPMNEKTAQ